MVRVEVYCKNCHRPSNLDLKLGVSEKQVRENAPCPNCNSKGELVYTSSM